MTSLEQIVKLVECGVVSPARVIRLICEAVDLDPQEREVVLGVVLDNLLKETA